MSTKRLIVGNWKMNPNTLADAKKIARKSRTVAAKLTKTEIVICPPFPFIVSCVPRVTVRNYNVGAQLLSAETNSGAHTGEVNALMLRDIGVEYTIIGHSEQREKGDSDKIVSERLRVALGSGIKPILCVGEKSRDEGGAYLEELKNQIKNSLTDVPKKFAENIVMAYEPVWAIGRTEAMAPAQIYEMSIFVKKIFADVFGPENGLRAKVLYGGAVNFRNAFEIITVGQVDGLLVGHESVNMPGFVELLRAVDKIDL